MIKFENVGMRIRLKEGERWLFKDISFALARGESLAVVGPSGSGKSTLLDIASGLIRPTAGLVDLNGNNYSQLRPQDAGAARALLIGLVFQDFRLISSLTVIENVLVPAYITKASGLGKRAAELLAAVGLGDRAHDWPDKLSGGEKQRVAIARALILSPGLLVCDEPTGSLDSETGEVISEILFSQQRERSAAILLATHDPVLAAKCSTRIDLGGKH